MVSDAFAVKNGNFIMDDELVVGDVFTVGEAFITEHVIHFVEEEVMSLWQVKACNVQFFCAILFDSIFHTEVDFFIQCNRLIVR